MYLQEWGSTPYKWGNNIIIIYISMFIFHPSPRVGKHSLLMGKQYYIYLSILVG